MGKRETSARCKPSCSTRHDRSFRTREARGIGKPLDQGRGGLAAVALLLLLSLPALAEPTAALAEVDALERSYVEALAGLCRWCRGVRLNGTADLVAKELLEIEPDHEGARRWLGYKRRRGTWMPPKSPKVRKDWNREAKKSYPARRAVKVDALVDRYWSVYAELQGEEAAEARERLLAIAVARWPRDPRFRRAGGETHRDGLWMLVESARADGVYKRLRDSAAQLLAAAPKPRDAMPPPILEPFGLYWRGASRCGGITVASMTSPEESDNVAQHCVVAAALFRLVFGVETELPADFTVALGSGQADYSKVISSPVIPDAMRKQLRNRCGFTLRDPNLFFASPPDAATRLDGAVRTTVDLLREKAFGDFGRLGWVTEGFGTYLTWLVCGTRLSSFGALDVATRSATGRAPSRNLGDDWLANARRLAASGKLPELTYVVSVDHSAMTSRDVLAAYAFAVYLVTGRPGQVQRFLSVANNGQSTADAAIEVTGMDIPALDLRFRRWLRECH